MAALDTLPIELITNVASYLSPQDVKTLSRTNWFMRHAVVGVLFRTLYIPCPLASTRALEELIHKYQNFISRFHLHVYFQPNMEEKPHDGPMPSVWGAASTDTLKRIVRGDILSNVSSFVVEFNARNFEHDGWWGETASWSDPNMLGSIVDNEENWDQTLQQEREIIWRAQYNDVMQTISTNQNITNLKISNLIPRNASAWETPEWESFLGRLQVLEIGVFGGDDGDCWHTKPEFAEFIGNLPHFVMRHARNVRHLTLEASPDGLFGGASTNYCIPLPLKEDHFLFLHSLTLKNIMIGPELVEFLTSRVDSLEELELYDCMCDGPDWEYGSDRELDPVTWAGLWKAIRESNIRLFKLSVVQSRKPPLMWREGDRKEFETIEDSVEAARIRKMLEEDSHLVLWRYARVDYKYGWVVDLSDDNVKYFEAGEDQREYVKLLKVLEERNRQRG
ncbi:hypothetical protein FOCG_15455 [Fusarium oxysporum f. sp. radicis-lycopersici 26381]|uniref:F-box domain-containing protein n=1 Tax=Fusarium oxysporum f. sp. narcissi TaxID=451672 RepID=A0A4Q2VHW8_FUSOX|nr:hypothetical protein FOCG_15455 [Fusarium oxysporum f. sp. radicis-lycopersici 26381]RYC85338.1 hypothetical protein BFJ63_vAg11762 [Fusarium oxysporum f. sp. narcissi]